MSYFTNPLRENSINWGSVDFANLDQPVTRATSAADRMPSPPRSKSPTPSSIINSSDKISLRDRMPSPSRTQSSKSLTTSSPINSSDNARLANRVQKHPLGRKVPITKSHSAFSAAFSHSSNVKARTFNSSPPQGLNIVDDLKERRRSLLRQATSDYHATKREDELLTDEIVIQSFDLVAIDQNSQQ